MIKFIIPHEKNVIVNIFSVLLCLKFSNQTTVKTIVEIYSGKELREFHHPFG
jgi:hypothetical protein